MSPGRGTVVATLLVLLPLGGCSGGGGDAAPTPPAPTTPALSREAAPTAGPLTVERFIAAPPALSGDGAAPVPSLSRVAAGILAELDAETIDVDGELSTRVTLPDTVLFAFDEAALLPAAERVLDDLVTVLEETATAPVTIGGHTDGRGSDAYNLELSQRRARSVATYFRGAGVADERLDAVGYGETRPVAQETTAGGADDPDGRARNRRVEVVIEGVDPAG